MFNNKTILITGGTGSFGKKFCKIALNKYKKLKIIIFSRDEMKQWEMDKEFNSQNLKFIIGDIRDFESLNKAMKGVDYVIHAAATKIITAAEDNPEECIKTNVNGTINIAKAAIQNSVKKLIALSTDKACNPTNFYGASKLLSEKIILSENKYQNYTKMSVVRYGNVLGSRGSVVPFFQSLNKSEHIPITDLEMTRFIITLSQAVEMVLQSFQMLKGGEIIIKKIPSTKITDIAKAINNIAKIKIIGIRPSEKIHEEMISSSEARDTIDYNSFFIIIPDNKKVYNSYLKVGKKVKNTFSYNSSNNSIWLNKSDISKLIKKI